MGLFLKETKVILFSTFVKESSATRPIGGPLKASILFLATPPAKVILLRTSYVHKSSCIPFCVFVRTFASTKEERRIAKKLK